MVVAAPKRYADKTCESCGGTYSPTSGRQKWCSPACRDGETVETPVLFERSGTQVGAWGDLDPQVAALVDEAVSANAAGLAAASGRGWRSAAWGFAQEIREHPVFIDLTGPEAMDRLEPYLEAREPATEWVPDADGFVPDAWVRNLGGFDSKGDPMDPAEDFLRVWDLVRIKALALALRRVETSARYRDPGAFGPELAADRRAPFRRFLAVAAECCRVGLERTGEPVAPLATQAIADALLTARGRPTERKTVGGWRAEAIARGFIAEEKPPSSRGRRAGEYRWIATDLDDRVYRPNPPGPGSSGRPAPAGGEEPGF